LRRSRALIMCVLASSLTACSSESLEMTTTDLGQRWKVERQVGLATLRLKKAVRHSRRLIHMPRGSLAEVSCGLVAKAINAFTRNAAIMLHRAMITK
jgi:hypothetical protein